MKKKLISNLLYTIKKKSLRHASQPLRTRLVHTHKKYRVLNSTFFNLDVPGVILKTEYDPYRSSNIVLVLFRNNICCYYLKVTSTNIGSYFINSLNYDALKHYKRGSSCSLRFVPNGGVVNQIDVNSKKYAVYSKSLGASSMIMRKNSLTNTITIKLNSGKIKLISDSSFGTLGSVGKNWSVPKKYYKAGQLRWIGRRPMVRGVAKNPVDHGHGGGEGKRSKSVIPKTFWGKKLKWRKTARI